MTSIEWTRGDDGSKGETWNPVVGCTVLSAGCTNCYAMGVAHRGMRPEHRGLTVLRGHGKGPRWNGTVRFLPERLQEPFSWRKPRRVFVNSMSDLFHEGVTDEQIASVFGVMAGTPKHTYQILTKRLERARAFLSRCAPALGWITHNGNDPISFGGDGVIVGNDNAWPLPNVWLGASVEDQATADERIPVLLETPAAIRWVSYEPALGPVNFADIALAGAPGGRILKPLVGLTWGPTERGYTVIAKGAHLDWIVVGGESGPRARPFDVAWAASTIAQCRAAGVPVFCKQLGANVRTRNDDNFTIDEDPPDEDFPGWPSHLANEERVEPIGRDAYQGAPVRVRLRDRKGGDMSEWRTDLRVRQFPEVRRAG